MTVRFTLRYVLHEKHGHPQPISIQDNKKTSLFLDPEDEVLILNFIFSHLAFRAPACIRTRIG